MEGPSLFLSLYFDEDVSIKIVRSLRNRGFDVRHVVEAGMIGKTDEEQLHFAATNERALVTHNRIDFEGLHARYLAEGREHKGIIVARRRRNNEEVTRRLLHLLNTTLPEDMSLQLRYI